MNLHYKSTRNSDRKVTASEAILKGLAPDGGLFVPEEIPKLDISLDELKDMTYQQTAYEVMKLFLKDFTEEELKDCINKAYDSKFDTEEIAPLVKIKDTYYLELFHGATIAFKDMALSILPHLMTTAARTNSRGNFRRYRKGCDGGVCGCGRDKDYRILSKERRQQSAGTADGYSKRKECRCSRDSR